jgi:hypothetical protein
VANANAFFSLFPAFFDTLSVYSGDTGSVSVYGQARRFPNWMLPDTHSIHT